MVKIVDLPEIEKEIYWICIDSPKSIYEIIAELIRTINRNYSASYVGNLCNILVAKKLMMRITTISKKNLYHSIAQENETNIQM